MLKEVLIRIHGFDEVKVIVDTVLKKAYAKDSFFAGSAVIGYDKKIVAITDDITTNYLDVAMAMAMRKVGLKVKAEKPTPRNLFEGKTRRFTIISVKDAEPED